jgi:hypothetical protein
MCLVIAPLVNADEKTQRVQFQKGRTTAVIKSSVIRDNDIRYLLGAKSRQYMTVHVSGSDSVAFQIYSPSGKDLTNSSSGFTKDWEGELPESGDTQILVFTDKYKPQGFTLEVGIR